MRNTVVVARLEGRAHGWYEQYRERFGEEVQGEHVIRHQQRLGLARQERLEPAPPTEREPPSRKNKGMWNRYIASMGASNAGSHTLSPSPFLRWPKLTSTMPTPLATSIHSTRLEPLISHPVPLSS